MFSLLDSTSPAPALNKELASFKSSPITDASGTLRNSELAASRSALGVEAVVRTQKSAFVA